jgi:hypothetical protein
MTYGGVEILLPHSSTSVLDGGEWSALHTCCFPQGKEPFYLLYRRLSGLQNRSGRYGKDKNLLLLPGTEPRNLA